jgi:hypothetical protein
VETVPRKETFVMRVALHVGALAVGMLALRAAADLSGGASPFVTVTSSTGFVPVTWSEPTNGVGFGSGGRHGGSGPVPFAGWVDFGLLGDQSVTVDWNFMNESPSQWTGWNISRLDARDTPLAGVSWDGAVWQALGLIESPADVMGAWSLRLMDQPGRFDYRLAFGGFTTQPETISLQQIAFAVPAPGTAALIGLAAVMSRRRRA